MLAVMLIVAFIGVPLLELWVILEVGSRIGVFPTIAALLMVSVVGGWLVHRIGYSVWQRARNTLARGELPARELLDGAIVFGAGVLLVVPGFVTDVIGLLVLTPIVRALIRRRVLRTVAAEAPQPPVTIASEWDVVSDADVVDGTLAPPRGLPPADD